MQLSGLTPVTPSPCNSSDSMPFPCPQVSKNFPTKACLLRNDPIGLVSKKRCRVGTGPSWRSRPAFAKCYLVPVRTETGGSSAHDTSRHRTCSELTRVNTSPRTRTRTPILLLGYRLSTTSTLYLHSLLTYRSIHLLLANISDWAQTPSTPRQRADPRGARALLTSCRPRIGRLLPRIADVCLRYVAERRSECECEGFFPSL